MPATTSSSSISAGGLKKCMPTTLLGPRGGARQRRSPGGRRCWWRAPSRGRRPPRAARKAPASAPMSSGAASITRSHRRDPRCDGAVHALQRQLRVVPGPAPALDALLQAGRDRLQAALERLREGVVQMRLEAGQRRDLRDAGAHRARADHAERAYLAQRRDLRRLTRRPSSPGGRSRKSSACPRRAVPECVLAHADLPGVGIAPGSPGAHLADHQHAHSPPFGSRPGARPARRSGKHHFALLELAPAVRRSQVGRPAQHDQHLLVGQVVVVGTVGAAGGSRRRSRPVARCRPRGRPSIPLHRNP